MHIYTVYLIVWNGQVGLYVFHFLLGSHVHFPVWYALLSIVIFKIILFTLKLIISKNMRYIEPIIVVGDAVYC